MALKPRSIGCACAISCDGPEANPGRLHCFDTNEGHHTEGHGHSEARRLTKAQARQCGDVWVAAAARAVVPLVPMSRDLARTPHRRAKRAGASASTGPTPKGGGRMSSAFRVSLFREGSAEPWHRR